MGSGRELITFLNIIVSVLHSRMTWVANELLLDKKYFYLECMRIPPDWHLWVYILGTEKEAAEFQVEFTLFGNRYNPGTI